MEEKLRIKLTVRLFTEEKCFGPGVAELLVRVREHHSLRAASASMEMAYSMAWKIIRQSEAALGCKLLTSSTGGRGGGGAVVTPEAEQLLEAYGLCCEKLQAYAQDLLEEHFSFYSDWQAPLPDEEATQNSEASSQRPLKREKGCVME